MSAKRDREILEEAGIPDPDRLVQAAAAFLRQYPLTPLEHRTEPPTALSNQEQTFLRAGGACGVDGGETDTFSRNITVVAAEYAQMATTAFSQRQVAKMLDIPASRVRQRIQDRTLYVIEGPASHWVFPRFQFANGRCLPGLEAVLAAINPNAHPVAVLRFFLMQTADLESPEVGRALSPREWLFSGHPADEVVMLAREL